MKYLVPLLLLFFAACNNPEAPKKLAPKVVVIEKEKGLEHKIFFFAPKLDRYTCEVYGDCECCWDNIVFIDELRFVRIYYCDADRRFRKGTYTERNDSIFLVYNSTQINKELNWDWMADSIKDSGQPSGYSFTNEEVEKMGDTIVPHLCNGILRYRTLGEDSRFGMPDSARPYREYLLELNMDSIPGRMGFKIEK